MNAVVRALFDDAAITGAQAAGLKDTSTAAMRAAVREWFELFFMREAVKGKDEDPAQRIPYTITNKLTKACLRSTIPALRKTEPEKRRGWTDSAASSTPKSRTCCSGSWWAAKAF